MRCSAIRPGRANNGWEVVVTGQQLSSLGGAVAVVTGAGRGIGRAIALHLARDGATVVVSSRTSGDLESVVTQVVAEGGRALHVVADSMDRDQAKAPVRAAIETFGRIDVLVNNVGGRLSAQHFDVDQDPYTCDDGIVEAVVTLNLFSAWWATREALPHMRAQHRGRIINIGSGVATRAGGSVGYTAAKHGLVGLTKALATNTAKHGITVNCLCPGWTNSWHDWDARGAVRGISGEEARRHAEGENLVGRLIEPEEYGPMVLLLASAAGAAITGQVINVDGGYKI